MSAQQTQGRLIVMKDGARALGNEANMITTEAVDGPLLVYGQVSDADSRRLVACWNAFDGMATELIEGIPACGVDGLANYAADHKREGETLRAELDIAGADLADAHVLLAEVLAADDMAINELAAIGLLVQPEDTDLTERIRALLAPPP